MTTAPPNIPLNVTRGPVHKQLSPAEYDDFLRKQAEYEAAYRRTGDPLALQEALSHVWFGRQTVPLWLMQDIRDALIRQRTDEEAERYRDRMRHVRRFIVVRNLRRMGHTKDAALDLAVGWLAAERAAASRRTIQDSYDTVKRDLNLRGRESVFFYFAAEIDQLDLPEYVPYSLTE
jgi:hypothetical protein